MWVPRLNNKRDKRAIVNIKFCFINFNFFKLQLSTGPKVIVYILVINRDSSLHDLYTMSLLTRVSKLQITRVSKRVKPN